MARRSWTPRRPTRRLRRPSKAERPTIGDILKPNEDFVARDLKALNLDSPVDREWLQNSVVGHTKNLINTWKQIGGPMARFDTGVEARAGCHGSPEGDRD